jgi:hypothetical protein
MYWKADDKLTDSYYIPSIRWILHADTSFCIDIYRPTKNEWRTDANNALKNWRRIYRFWLFEIFYVFCLLRFSCTLMTSNKAVHIKISTKDETDTVALSWDTHYFVSEKNVEHVLLDLPVIQQWRISDSSSLPCKGMTAWHSETIDDISQLQVRTAVWHIRGGMKINWR